MAWLSFLKLRGEDSWGVQDICECGCSQKGHLWTYIWRATQTQTGQVRANHPRPTHATCQRFQGVNIQSTFFNWWTMKTMLGLWCVSRFPILRLMCTSVRKPVSISWKSKEDWAPTPWRTPSVKHLRTHRFCLAKSLYCICAGVFASF